jgi:GNAT superfamily N-acetyltransferase
MVSIKRATTSDVNDILKLVSDLFDELGHKFPIPGGGPSESFCERLIDSGDYRVFLAYDSHNSVCGVITLNETTSIYAGGKFGVIREFYVMPEMRSSGIGKALIDAVKQLGQSKGWNRIEVTLPPKHKWNRTYDFYMREGFVEVGPRLKLENLGK